MWWNEVCKNRHVLIRLAFRTTAVHLHSIITFLLKFWGLKLILLLIQKKNDFLEHQKMIIEAEVPDDDKKMRLCLNLEKFYHLNGFFSKTWIIPFYHYHEVKVCGIAASTILNLTYSQFLTWELLSLHQITKSRAINFPLFSCSM